MTHYMTESMKLEKAYAKVREGVERNGTISDFSWEGNHCRKAAETLLNGIANALDIVGKGRIDDYNRRAFTDSHITVGPHTFVFDPHRAAADGVPERITVNALHLPHSYLGLVDGDIMDIDPNLCNAANDVFRHNRGAADDIAAALGNSIRCGSMDVLTVVRTTPAILLPYGLVFEVEKGFSDDSMAWFIEQTGMGRYEKDVRRDDSKYFRSNLRKPNLPR